MSSIPDGAAILAARERMLEARHEVEA